MRKATAIYHAPEGDSKVVEMGGVTFFDGKEIELNTDDHDQMISKLANNQHFEIEVGEEEKTDKPRRGPKPRDLKAGIEEGRDHDFEADRRSALNKQTDQPKTDQAPDKGKGDENPLGFTGTSPKPAKEPA